MRKLLLALSTVLVAAVPALAQEGPLEIAVDQAPVGLDPHLVTAFSSFVVIQNVYDGLVEFDADLQIEPALATSWEISDDGLTYDVQLRDDVVFHNGRAMTAEDVVYSFDRIMAEETGSPQASRFAQVTGAEATGEHAVRFTLEAPFAPFLGNLSNLTVVPREVVEAEGDLQRVAVGTGPFVLEEVVPDTYVRLVANPDYYRDGQPAMEEVRFNVVPEASTRAAGLRTGSYHLLPDVDPATAETLQNVSGVELMEVQDLAYSLLGVNVEREPFDDPRVRRAINLAIDRDEIVTAVYFDNAVPGGPLSPGLDQWALDTSEFSCYQHDPARAQELLAEAGYEDGFELEILTFGTIRVVSDLAQVLQAQLTEVGIDTTVNVAEFGTFVQDWRNSDFQAFVSLNGGNADPDGYLFRTFHSTGATNVFQYASEQVDALLERGRTTADDTARYATYAELQRSLACTGPVAHVAYATLFSGVRENVEGFQQMPTRNMRYLRETSLE
jgi:peptide/nickel transport system substrate-binding protein